jgi:hypothetical protein
LNEQNETRKVVLFIAGAVVLCVFLALLAAGCSPSQPPAQAKTAVTDATMPEWGSWRDDPANHWLRVSPPGPTWRVTGYGEAGEEPRALAVAFDEWDGTFIRYDMVLVDTHASPEDVTDDIFRNTSIKPFPRPMSRLRRPEDGPRKRLTFAYETGNWHVRVIVMKLTKNPGVMLIVTGRARPEHAASLEQNMISSIKDAVFF